MTGVGEGREVVTGGKEVDRWGNSTISEAGIRF